MPASKINEADAQEWLASLQQVGEGWWRQVALAVRAGAHKALKMERREFVQTIGQRMIDPREAIIELHREGHSIKTIADILGVAPESTVKRVLAEEGLVEWTPSVVRKALASGYSVPDDATALIGGKGTSDAVAPNAGETDDAVVSDELRAEIDRLTIQMKGQEAQHKRDLRDFRKKLKDVQQMLNDAEREAREQAQRQLTDAERERARKEAEAWADEEGRKILAGLAHLVVAQIVGALEEAREGIQELVSKSAVSETALSQIENAHAGFMEELNVARMSVDMEGITRGQ